MTIYENGQGVTQDTKKARNYFNKFTDKHNPVSLFTYAVFYIHDATSKNDYIKTQTLLNLYYKSLNDAENRCYKYAEKIAKKGSVPIICDARIADKPLHTNIQDLLAVITIKLQHSNNEINNAIRQLELYDINLPDNIEYNNEVVTFYTKGFQRIFLAQLYLNGKLVPRDYKKAKTILENLLSHNQQTVSQALYLLGNIYQKGLGVKKDPIRAKKYYNNACLQENDEACHALQTLYKKDPQDK